ncbi:uncharacterized protein LOC123319819 [Coccinella septempunctata]|uniref:uncharacterized protein LOC123319819 n=1 Tax=Coccinella septempunctata TaxID=41139 RepID=UPI001D07AB8F|nr:uncharacterized protein LOC123319819 [Coccinella septempunctata]
MISAKRIEARLHRSANKIVREKLFPPLRDDDITRTIKYDELVIIYANKMSEKYRDGRYFDMIRQRIRLIGRFLKALKAINKDIKCLSDVFVPAYCPDSIRVINTLAGADDGSGHFKHPSVATALCSLLKYIGKIYLNQCIIKHDDAKQKDAKSFLLHFTQQVDINVTRTVMESQVQNKIKLPSLNDIKKFYIYLKKNLGITYKRLKNRFSLTTWLNLSEFTLLSIQVINRIRPRELERILIQDFKRHEGISADTNKTLYKKTRQKASRYRRFMIQGKLNRTIPVILDEEHVKCIELLLKYRGFAKISGENQYVFAIPEVTNSKCLRACNVMRKHAILCGANHPERLRGRNSRKHIATTCLKFTEVKELKNINETPVASRYNSRVSRLPQRAQENNVIEENDCTDNEEEEEGPRRDGKHQRSTSPYGTVKRRRWTTEEIQTTLKEFKVNFEIGKLPSFKEIQEVKSRCPQLSLRSQAQIKTWIHNQFRKKSKG